MRLLLVNSFYSPNVIGGAERVVELLAQLLVRKGHEVAVASLNLHSPRAWSETVRGVKVYYLPLKNLYVPFKTARPNVFRKAIWHAADSYNASMAGLFAHVLRQETPDLVHTHNLAGFSVAVWKAVKRHGLPLVHTLHDHYLLCPRSTMFRGGRNCTDICTDCRLYAWPRRRMTTLVDAVVGVSHYILDRHLAYGYFTRSKRYVVYNGYDVPKGGMPQSRVERSDSESNTAFPLRFGYLGRLHPTKGVDQLLRSFLALPSGRAELRIAGKGEPEYEANLKKMTKERADVQWLGFMPPEEFFKAVDVLVVPSLLQDSAPMVVLEAMGNGVPVLGARRGGIPELVGEAGWVFDPDKPGDLEAHLRRCLGDPAEVKVMSQRARERAKLFSSENMLSSYLRIYESLLKESAR
ncbi:glycosyltransferase family 4 protein [Thermus sp. FJN-A]